MRKTLGIVGLCLVSSTAAATTINTNDVNVYNAFAAGATLVNFTTVSGLTPLPLTSYANTTDASIPVPPTALLSNQIAGLHFHSGGGSFNNPAATPGTPAALLALDGGIAGDARSSANVFGALQIQTSPNDPTVLDLNAFVEIIFTGGNVNRAGVWLNPSLGNVLLTVFDSSGSSLESIIGSAGNFVAVERAANDIRFLSLVSVSQSGFTADDLTFGQASVTNPTDAPSTWLLLLAAGAALTLSRRNLRRA
jgi:hypothetical protein